MALLDGVAFVNQSGESVPASSLSGKIVLVYFSASWHAHHRPWSFHLELLFFAAVFHPPLPLRCPPCRAFTPKLKDFYAWSYDVGEVPKRAQKAHDEIAALPEVTTRPVDMNDVLGDVRIIMDIFNDAWSDNWGFVPATEREIQKSADDMKLILMPEITNIVSIDGEPAAVAIGLPDVNEVIRDLDGKLGPVGAEDQGGIQACGLRLR